jgi:hypothetical protein
MNNDGIQDLVVGTYYWSSAGMNEQGAVFLWNMNRDGTVKPGFRQITHSSPSLDAYDMFGNDVAFLGDVDGE